MRKKKRTKKRPEKRELLFLAGILCLLLLAGLFLWNRNFPTGSSGLSDSVLQYEPLVKQYAQEYGISRYKKYLLAILQVESAGLGTDVMQSAESLGLAPGSLSPEESIRQGCAYFSTLLNYGEELGCDLNSVLQAYNYGIGFLDYTAENGKAYTFDLACSYASRMSGGNTVAYENPTALEINGGWRYTYGNMFYVLLLEPYL